jgi:hypothetical protein
MLVFWFVTSCGFVGRYQRFKETYCLHLYLSPEEGGRVFIRNFGIYVQVHTESQPRRPSSTSTLSLGPQMLQAKRAPGRPRRTTEYNRRITERECEASAWIKLAQEMVQLQLL